MSSNPELTLYEQFYKLAQSGEHLEDYADRQMFVTPYGTWKKEGFVAVIEGSNGMLLCMKTGNDYWRGFFCGDEEPIPVFDTANSDQTRDANSLATALFASLEKRHLVKRVSDQQFSIDTNWNEPTKFKAHWVGK